MGRRAAAVTQAQIARAIRAAKKAGATSVEIDPDGKIHIEFNGKRKQSTEVVEAEEELKL